MAPRTVQEEMLLQARKELMRKIGNISGWGSVTAIAGLVVSITITQTEIACTGTPRVSRLG